MALVHSFVSGQERSFAEAFMADGFVIQPVDDRPALDALRAEVVGLVAAYLKRPMPEDHGHFLDHIHEILPVADLNALRLHLYHTLNGFAWLRPTYFALARKTIETLVGNELAMQNRVNMSIQMPNDDSSVLDIHADSYGGDTPFQVVQWLPLVDVYDTKAMFILRHEKSKIVNADLARVGDGGMDKLYKMVEPDLEWLTVPYGSVLVFTPNCLHGNIVNRVPTTRWSMNSRFTGLFTPYTSYEKKIGSYYLPITTRAVSRIGMEYREPAGFEE